MPLLPFARLDFLDRTIKEAFYHQVDDITSGEYMSWVYFITPYDPKDWQDDSYRGEVPQIFTVDSELFSLELKKQWPSAEIQDAPSDSTMEIYWNLLPTDSIRGLDGRFQKDQQTLTIQGGIDHDLIKFIMWYRQFIPAQYKLYLFDSSSFERLELTPEIVEDQIRKFTSRYEPDEAP